MTYSVIAHCPRTGQLGIGIASYSIAIGMYCDGAARANIGVTTTQGAPNPRNNRLAVNLLAEGYSVGHVLKQLLANDPASDYRQVGVLDRDGAGIAHCGPVLPRWSGHRIGTAYVALGTQLAGDHVLDALCAGFEEDPQLELDARLLFALEKARDAGGIAGRNGRLPERSAAVVVFGKQAYSETDLRVDCDDRAVAELRRIYTDYKPSIAYYDERARHPRNAVPAMEFAEMLKAKQHGSAS